MALFEQNAFLGKAVKMRRVYHLIAVTGKCFSPQFIWKK